MQDTTQATSSPSSLAIGQLCSLYEVSAPLSDLHGKYQDTPEAHTALYNYCLDRVQETPYLRQHRDFIESKQFGYGERPFHWMWHTLVSAMPANFRFLEIGVFQGQTLSLAQLAAREQGKRGTFVGVTPLDSTGDRTATHPALNYQARIARLHREFGLDAPTILKGLSFDPRVQQVAREDGPLRLV